ncbi:NADH-quinone oxidoreductase subunit C [Helicobacter sp. MIT 99-5507]|uniref:NADH-quinone oxidoreductase subunit C n=1 Tax=Helicobacter sp. MIT 99-5507 TaxID=152489 RepID=UPI000E1FA798|nr:NADH-quinone oxidoreductase subunit C [Helicobacter sp. MIT 99-5507]RDU57388.1 NADH-quinone oxidoreductase subunit C [Helicobacter sp. MIT 99-5507]
MQDIQKKVYHKNRFYQAPHTLKQNPNETKFSDVFSLIESKVNIIKSYVELDNLVIFINKDEVLNTFLFIKEISFDILSEMSAIHLSDDSFEVFYQLLSMDKKLRLRVKTHTKDCIDSISHIYRNALWSEREAYDMFGIKFNNHKALKRILMPDDWSGHPLRKDYPLHGDLSAQWYEIDKIFGEEYRDVVGPENRDSSYINPKDTFNFAHMGFEVAKGEQVSSVLHDITYQENKGVFVVTKFDKSKELTKRR